MANVDLDTGNNTINLHRSVSLDVLKNNGLMAVAVNTGQKAPQKGWDPKTNNKDKSAVVIAEASKSEMSFGVHLNNDVVDVDIDVDSPVLMAALDEFLPPCLHVWGRHSRPRTHRLYRVREGDFNPSNYPFLYRIKRIEQTKVELRGGPLSRGEYSVMPGCEHPSGEKYEWSNLSAARSTLAITETSVLTKALRMAGVVAVLGDYWVEGARNDMVMALSGFLYRVVDLNNSLASEAVITPDDARYLVEVLLRVVDDPSDTYSRMKTFDATWEKAKRGAAVTGVTRLAELAGDPDLIKTLYTLLSDGPQAALVDSFIERFAIWQGPGAVIDMELARKGAHKPIMTRTNFVNSWGHVFVYQGDKRKLLADAMFHYAATTRVNGLTFAPGDGPIVESEKGKMVNQWGGYEVEPCEKPVKDADIEYFLTHVKEIIASGDEEVAHWVLAWMADIFKNPSKKSGTALVLVGKPGAGKSFLGHRILIPMIGDAHAISTNNVGAITKDFNALFDSKLFIQCDEATSNRQKATANRLKALITDPMIIVEPKNVDAYEKPNLARFMFTSNDVEDALHLNDGAHDRRYTVIEVSPKFKDKIDEFWHPYVVWLEDKDNLAKIHRYLLDYEYDPALVNRPIVTEAKQTMQQRSLDVFDSWLGCWLARGFPISEDTHNDWYDATDAKTKAICRYDWPEYVTLTALVRDYNHHVKTRENKGFAMLDESQLSRSLRKRVGFETGKPKRVRVTEFDQRKSKEVTKRIRLYVTPSPEAVSDYLIDKYGVAPEFATGADDEEVAEVLISESDGIEF